MLRIPCPYCGIRDQDEFQCGGEATVQRPAEPDRASDADWAGYLFYRDNVKGPHLERWFHLYGCRQWFLVERDTATHAIAGSRTLGAAGPGPESA